MKVSLYPIKGKEKKFNLYRARTRKKRLISKGFMKLEIVKFFDELHWRRKKNGNQQRKAESDTESY